jgi:hypothetical protein
MASTIRRIDSPWSKSHVHFGAHSLVFKLRGSPIIPNAEREKQWILTNSIKTPSRAFRSR